MHTESGVKLRNTYLVECHDKDGNLKWKEEINNTTVTVGLNDLLTQYFKGVTYSAGWNVGLKSTGSVVAGDTMTSHSNWTEVTAYTGTRPVLTLGTAAAGSIDNSASKAVFTMNNTYTVYGAFVCVGASGTAGILYGGADFTTPRSGASGDTLTVTITLTAASA